MNAVVSQQPQVSRRGSARARQGYTLLEMLFVTLIIGILIVLSLPVLAKSKARAKSVACSSQLRQVGIAMHDFSHDHLDQFPFQVPTNQGGSLEFARAGFAMSGEFFFAYRHLQVLSNALVTPRLLRCPTDLLRQPAQDFSMLQNSNLSYFVTTTAEFSQPESILCGDRNIAGESLASGSIVRVGTNSPVLWTAELHQFKGNLLFADAHVAQVNNSGLGGAVYASGTTIGYILPPVTPLPGGAGDEDGTSIFAAVRESVGPSVTARANAPGSVPSGDYAPAQPANTGLTSEPLEFTSLEPKKGPDSVSAGGLDERAAENQISANGNVNGPSMKRSGPASRATTSPGAPTDHLGSAQHPEQQHKIWLFLLLLMTVAAFWVGRQLHRRQERRRPQTT